MSTPLNQIPSPTDEQRHEMLKNALANEGRPEDYDNILKLLSPPPEITNFAAPGELRGVKIGIIGGGLAGLTAAYELRKTGADITIFESSEGRIGGRVYTHYFDEEKKYYAEFGAMRIPVSHETTWYYINKFKLETISMSSPLRNNFLFVHNTRLRTTDSVSDILYPKYNLTTRERNTPWPELNEYAFTYMLKQLSPSIRTELLKIMPNYSNEYLPIMNMSIRQALESLLLSQEAINLIAGVNSSTGSILNISYDELMQQEYSLDFRNLYRVKGGNVNLPLAIYHSIITQNTSKYYDIPTALLGRVTYNSGHYVNGIYKSIYGNRVILRYKKEKDTQDIAKYYDYIICTIPFSTLREIEIKPFFSNLKMQAIKELNYIDAQKTNFLCNKRFWEMDATYGNIKGGISFTDLPIQSIIYPTDHNLCAENEPCSPEEPGVLLASYNLHQNATRVGNQEEKRRIELIKQNVEEVHGLPRGYLNSIVEDSKTVTWNNEPNFRGALTLDLPGQKNLFSYNMTLPEYNNRIFFAGEHISNKHGWVQGALQSGKEAANYVAVHYHNM